MVHIIAYILTRPELCILTLFLYIDTPRKPESAAPEISKEKHFEVNTNLKPLFGDSDGKKHKMEDNRNINSLSSMQELSNCLDHSMMMEKINKRNLSH